MTYHPIPVAPTGQTTGPAFVCGPSGCRAGDVSHPTYPASGNGAMLRSIRQTGREWVTLRDAARRLGLKPSELSDLESGAATLSTEEWACLLDEAAAAMPGEE